MDELEKAISVAARDPALYGIDQAELERRVKWTRTTRTQVTHTYLIFLDMFRSKILVYFFLCHVLVILVIVLHLYISVTKSSFVS